MLPIDWDASGATSVVVLMDRFFAAQGAWVDYVRELAEEADARGFACRVFPVAMESEVLNALDGQLPIQVVSVPPGVPFSEVIYDAIPDSVMVACYSDSYSSSQWCRREVVEAKRHGIPMIVLDCLQDMDPRMFPYLGNVPVIRVDPEQGCPWAERVVTVLLEEVFRDLLWKCRVAPFEHEDAGVAFTSRKPELCLLAAFSRSGRTRPSVVYPGPSIGAEEERLFADIDPSVQLHTLDDWTRRHA